MAGVRFTPEFYAQQQRKRDLERRLGVVGETSEPVPPKPAKYRNRKTVVDGIEFDSAKEARRWQHLKLLFAGGFITDLQRQVEFPLFVNDELICVYRSDFVYTDANGRRITEDVKSAATRKLPAFRIKAKLMLACYGVEIVEV